jgi:transposase-like protein
MKQLVDNLVEYLSMGKQEHLAFLDGLFYLLKQKDADVVDYQGLKAQSVSPQCPKCESINIIKNGHQQGQQLYQCKECGKNFRVTTGTFVYNLHKKELMLDYILCMLEGKSLRQCAKEIGIDLTTSYEDTYEACSGMDSLDTCKYNYLKIGLRFESIYISQNICSSPKDSIIGKIEDIIIICENDYNNYFKINDTINDILNVIFTKTTGMPITSPLPLNDYLHTEPLCSNRIYLFLTQPPSATSIQSFKIIYKETEGTIFSATTKPIYITP